VQFAEIVPTATRYEYWLLRAVQHPNALRIGAVAPFRDSGKGDVVPSPQAIKPSKAGRNPEPVGVFPGRPEFSRRCPRSGTPGAM